MSRLVHTATDGLSAEAQRVMAAGFRARKTYRAIVRDLVEIGVKVPERTVARRGVEWRGAQARREAAREQVQDLVAAMKDQNFNAAEMLQALATDALLADPQAWAGQDPMRVQGQNLKAEELRLKREEVELRRRAHELNAKKFDALERREQQARELAAESERRDMTPEEMRAKIRDIYGLTA
jgi:hypothetical protein